MPVSSLIFVVILAVWAVYLVQHWVRRRDHLATARSVDRFSESMRVLERRRTLPRPDLSEPSPRSYSVSPLRPARPEVVVKRGAHVVLPSAAQRTARLAAKLRFGTLLLGSVAMVTLVGLSIAGVLAEWGYFAGIGAMVLALGLVRLSTSQEKARRRRAARARRGVSSSATPTRRPEATPSPAPAKTSSRNAGANPTRRPQRAQPAENVESVASVQATERDHAFARQSVAATTRTARRSVLAAQLYDIDRVEASLAADAAPMAPDHDAAAGDEGDNLAAVAPAGHWSAPREETPEPGAWQPVPVPPPTYTLKARAARATVSSSPAGSTHLPADGSEMALDEEFEDLPRVDRVG
ncbi:hypothetical protein [Ornithinimicrobium sp. Y1694]|uniref:hypothetical protein n=1 Tax=Ornithinimicrobium sp. Y1694 TaxID=3418590 RepID=UPI003CFB4936